jgi:DNA-directed RNA polymerase specialized sigma24 family protein
MREGSSPRDGRFAAWAAVTPAQFARALTTLPDDLRVVFEALALAGESYAQLGARLDLSREEVAAKVGEARDRLLGALWPRGPR